MSFTDDGSSPGPDPTPDTPQVYSNPSHSDLAAVAATVSVVGIIMAVLVAWLIFRLRRVPPEPESNSSPRPALTTRPSFAPSEASSKFAFARKPLRLSHRQQNPSWDFADPDPFCHPNEKQFDRKPSQKKHRPSPLSPTPAYTPGGNYFSSKHKDDTVPWTPTTPITPATADFVDPPPPAYCPDGVSWTLYQSKDLPPLSPK